MRKHSYTAVVLVLVALLSVSGVSALAGGGQPEPTKKDKLNVDVTLRGEELLVNVTDNYVGLFGLTTEDKLIEEDATKVYTRSNYTAFSIDVSVNDTRTPEDVSEDSFLSNLYLRVNPKGGGSYSESDSGFGIGYNTEFLNWKSSDFDGSRKVASITQRGYISFGIDLKYEIPEGAKPGSRRTTYSFVAIPKG